MVNKNVAMTFLAATVAFGFIGCKTPNEPKEVSLQAGPKVVKGNAATAAIKPLVRVGKSEAEDGLFVRYSGTTTVSGTAKYNEYSCELCLYVDDESKAMIPDPLVEDRNNKRVFAIGMNQRDKLGVNKSLIGEGKGCYTQRLKVQITNYKVPVLEESAFDSATVVKVIEKGALKEISCD